MAKALTRLEKHLRANPAAKRHGRVIKETLKALQALKDAGVSEHHYGLGSTYGGSKKPREANSRKLIPSLKMTYCA